MLVTGELVTTQPCYRRASDDTALLHMTQSIEIQNDIGESSGCFSVLVNKVAYCY